MSKLFALFLIPLPSRLKILLLRLAGHDIHFTAYIGISFLDVRKFRLGANTYIGHGNIFSRLYSLKMSEGARINRWNRITSPTGINGEMVLGERASIALRHYFDVCDRITIGNDTIIAGHRSTFFTHSKGIDIVDYSKPIMIGDWCYVGSNCCFVPGATVGSHCFVGMGAVVVGDLGSLDYALLGGNPARKIKDISKDAAYFRQARIVHPHMFEGKLTK
jgi:acetyltransferase-like isoleucine patch superfamily enzyme